MKMKNIKTETSNVCRNRERSSDVLLKKPKKKICSIYNAVVKRHSQLMISVTSLRKFLVNFKKKFRRLSSSVIDLVFHYLIEKKVPFFRNVL
jgi:hypothetical protein